jgi:hypothetical protein
MVSVVITKFLAVKTSAASVRAPASNNTIQGCRALAATVRPINEIRVDTMSAPKTKRPPFAARSYLLPITVQQYRLGGRNNRKVDIALPSLALLTASYLQPSSVNNIEFRWPHGKNTGLEDWVKFVLTVMRTRVDGTFGAQKSKVLRLPRPS